MVSAAAPKGAGHVGGALNDLMRNHDPDQDGHLRLATAIPTPPPLTVR